MSAKKESEEIVSGIVGNNTSPGNPDLKSRKKASKRSDKLRKKIEETADRIQHETRELAKEIIVKRLEESMDKEIEKLGIKLNLSEDKKRDIRSIIRGYKYAEILENAMIRGSVDATEKMLTQFFNRQAKNLGIKKYEDGFRDIKRTIDKVEKFTRRLDDLEKLSSGEHVEKLVKGMRQNLLKSIGIADFCKKLDNFMNQGGIYKRLTGSSFSSSGMMAPFFKKLESGIGKKLEGKLKPFIAKHIKVVKKISDTVRKIKDKIKLAEQHFKKMIKSYEDKARKYAEGVAKKVANEIMSKIKIGLKF